MSIEQEDGEVIEGIGMQEFHLISNSTRNDSNQEVSSQSNEDKWRKLIREPFYKVAGEAYLELKQREERMNHRVLRCCIFFKLDSTNALSSYPSKRRVEQL